MTPMNFWFFLAWMYFVLALSNPAFWGVALLFFVLGLNERNKETKEEETEQGASTKDEIDLKK